MSRADFSARHVWLGELGRTQRPGGFVCSADALGAAGRKARRTGVRGETYAYWYLRRNGYVMIARNFTYRGMKGEIDLVGYDGDDARVCRSENANFATRRVWFARRCGHRRESSGIFREWPGNLCANTAQATHRSDLIFLRLKPRPASAPSFVSTRALLPHNKNCNCSARLGGPIRLRISLFQRRPMLKCVVLPARRNRCPS